MRERWSREGISLWNSCVERREMACSLAAGRLLVPRGDIIKERVDFRRNPPSLLCPFLFPCDVISPAEEERKGFCGTNCPSVCLLGNAVLSRPTENCFCPFEATGAASLCFSPCLHPGKKDGSLPLSCLKDTFVNASVVLSPFSPKK